MALKDVDWLMAELDLPSRARAYDLARRGIVPSVRVGRLVKFDEGAIRRFVAAGGAAHATDPGELKQQAAAHR
jgi:hypothetical protein